MKAVVAAFNQEKALVGAFSLIVQPVVEPMEHYTALIFMYVDNTDILILTFPLVWTLLLQRALNTTAFSLSPNLSQLVLKYDESSHRARYTRINLRDG